MKEEIQQLKALFSIFIEQNPRRNKLPNTHNDEHTDLRQVRATCHVEGEELDEQSAVQLLPENKHSCPSDLCFNIIKAEQKCLLLELKAPSKILEDTESFRKALRALVIQIADTGKIDINKPSTITLKLIFKEDLTDDDIKVIKNISGHCFYSQRIDASRPIIPSPDLSEVNLLLSAVLNTRGLSLPVVRLHQSSVKYEAETLLIFERLLHGKFFATAVGSYSEGFANTVKGQSYSSDADFTINLDEFKVFEKFSEENEEKDLYPSQNRVIHLPDPKCPGYARVFAMQITTDLEDYCYVENSICWFLKFLKNTIKERIPKKCRLPLHTEIHGPAINTVLNPQNIPLALRKVVCALSDDTDCTDKRSEFSGIGDTDLVYCLPGEKWPFEASEWTTRKRYSNWPTKKLFDDIIKSGYVLAAVGSKESKDTEIQWRLSFNMAERLIIESFNETQSHCFWLLKGLKDTKLSKIAGKNITSFTMKTVMFWCLEEKKESFWKSSNLLSCFCFCVSKLRYFVANAFLPNYFIRKRNQFIVNQFNSDIQNKTIQYLDHKLEDFKSSLLSIVPCITKGNTLLSKLNIISEEYFIQKWLHSRVVWATAYHKNSVYELWKLYDGYNVKNILLRCSNELEKLQKTNYAQPFIKILQNCSGVLRYIMFKREQETFGHTKDFDLQECSHYMVSSVSADRTHTILRIASCLLDNGVKEECLSIIRSVTKHKEIYHYLQKNPNFIENTYEATSKKFKQMPSTQLKEEIGIHNKIIDQDHDPYTTIEVLKASKRENYEVCSYFLFLHIWKGWWFDVTFMPAEVSILPKPAALELCIDSNVKSITFHPILYGFLLEFLWHVQNDPENDQKEKVQENMKRHVQNDPKNDQKEKVLENMKSSVSMMTEDQMSRYLNFITYCCSLQGDYRSAAKYLIRSFKLNPIQQNVAYLYIKYIINLLRQVLDSKIKDL